MKSRNSRNFSKSRKMIGVYVEGGELGRSEGGGREREGERKFIEKVLSQMKFLLCYEYITGNGFSFPFPPLSPSPSPIEKHTRFYVFAPRYSALLPPPQKKNSCSRLFSFFPIVFLLSCYKKLIFFLKKKRRKVESFDFVISISGS